MTKDWMPQTSQLMTPYLVVKDADAAAEFYRKAFGFEVGERVPGEDGKTMHVGMTYHGKLVVMFAPEAVAPDGMQSPATSGTPEPVGLYVYCEDVDAQFKQALAAGCTKYREVEDMFWGDRMGAVRDPDGYAWTLATKLPDSDSEAPASA